MTASDYGRSRLDEHIARYREHRASPEYQQQLQHLTNLTHAFLIGLHTVWFASTRVPNFVNNSFFMRTVNDFIESAGAIQELISGGMRNPASGACQQE
jgi:hypothetical protein